MKRVYSNRIITQKSDPSVDLKVPAELFEALNQKAKKSGRSLSSELLIRLSRSVAAEQEEGYSAQEWLEIIFAPEVGNLV